MFRKLLNGTANALATGGVAPYTYSHGQQVLHRILRTQQGCNVPELIACFITDASGCSDTTIVNITQPQQLVLSAIAPQTICTGQNANLSTSATLAELRHILSIGIPEI